MTWYQCEFCYEDLAFDDLLPLDDDSDMGADGVCPDCGGDCYEVG